MLRRDQLIERTQGGAFAPGLYDVAREDGDCFAAKRIQDASPRAPFCGSRLG